MRMKPKHLILIPVVIITASLPSCIVPNSPDPVGDSFKRTGDAIGNVVNGVVGTVNSNAKQQQTPTSQQNYPQTTPYQTR